MARSIAMDDDGNLVALTQEEFNQLSDTEVMRGVSAPGLLDTVYLSSLGTVDKATGFVAESPCIGFISALLPAGKCLVKICGNLDGFTGLVPGDTYYLDPAVSGGIINTPPNVDGGRIVQEVGLAITDTKLLVKIGTIWSIL